MFRSQPAMVLALLAGAMAPAQAQPVSAFETYRPFADQEVAPWRQSNDTVREIGGWRAYAREAQQQAQDAGPAIPAEPLTQEAAVQLALANSPALKALEADARANVAAARQGARIANPLFSFERIRSPHELEIGRLLSIGLVELLTLPQRRSVARVQEEQARVRFAAALVEEVARVRQAWVRAVAAGELLAYARQVQQSADASAELARGGGARR